MIRPRRIFRNLYVKRTLVCSTVVGHSGSSHVCQRCRDYSCHSGFCSQRNPSRNSHCVHDGRSRAFITRSDTFKESDDLAADRDILRHSGLFYYPIGIYIQYDLIDRYFPSIRSDHFLARYPKTCSLAKKCKFILQAMTDRMPRLRA